MLKDGVSDWEIPPAGLRLEADEVHVWMATQHQPPYEMACLWKILSDDERERAGRFRFAKERHQFVVSRGALREILGGYLNLPGDSLRFQLSAYGKPSLAQGGCASRLKFNVSHSGGHLLFGFSIGRELGVDIEKMRYDFAPAELAKSCFSANELAVLETLPAELQTEAFFNGWTRKEAFIKAIGEGFSCPLDKFDVSLVPGEQAKLLAIRLTDQAASKWSISSLDCAADSKAAIVVEGADWRLKRWQFAINRTSDEDAAISLGNTSKQGIAGAASFPQPLNDRR
jgi:4'-phosphopantetheinyl transferase